MARIETQSGSRAEGVGEFDIPSATSNDGEAARAGRLARRLSRRGFLIASGAISLGVLTGCGGGDQLTPFSPAVDTTKAFQLSTRNVSGASKAAKSHAANKRFVSAAAAHASRAHTGDHSRIVTIDITPTTWDGWFGGGLDSIDLRTP